MNRDPELVGFALMSEHRAPGEKLSQVADRIAGKLDAVPGVETPEAAAVRASLNGNIAAVNTRLTAGHTARTQP